MSSLFLVDIYTTTDFLRVMPPRIEDYKTPPAITLERKIHGRYVYTARLCKHGKVEEARAYLEQHGLRYPPFSESKQDAARRLSAEAVKAGDVLAYTAKAILEPTVTIGADEVALHPVIAPEPRKIEGMAPSGEAVASVETGRGTVTLAAEHDFSVGAAVSKEQQGESGAPCVGLAPTDPVEIKPVVPPDPPAMRKAKVLGFPPNPRLVVVELEGGERASMWSSRKIYRQYEVVDVVLDRGTPGVNAIYKEQRKSL